MTELVWPVTVLIVAALAFVRTKPKPVYSVLGPDMEEYKAKIDRMTRELDDLQKRLNESTPKAVVDRLNVLSQDMLAVKPRVLAIEETLGAAVVDVGRLKTASALKQIVRKPE